MLLLAVACSSLVLPRAPPPRLAATVTEEDRLLALVAPTDAGVAATDEQRAEISALIEQLEAGWKGTDCFCLLYTSPSPRDQRGSRMPSSA